MLVDFGSLKGVLREVVGKLDHQNLNDFKEFDGDPSAERIAKYLFDRVLQGFVDSGGNGELLWALDVYETPTNMARYERSGL
jgi:6-pyruvoyltetrahydropterin/6-carboxytetrahydropterin synthase